MAGAAHPNHLTLTANYRRIPLVAFPLWDLFSSPRDALAFLSARAIAELATDLGTDVANEWLEAGAGPRWENFDAFNITPTGLHLTFDPYQVSSYGSGTRHVVVKAEDLLPLLFQNHPVVGLWERSLAS